LTLSRQQSVQIKKTIIQSKKSVCCLYWDFEP